MYALIANILAIIFVVLGILVANIRKPAVMLAFYTILSNIVTAISSVAFLIDRNATLTISLRYLSTVMLTMTVLVTLFVLVPAGAGFVNMMLSGNGLFHHTLTPLVSITSYIAWEQHSTMWPLPVAVTFIYGVVMLYVNYTGAFEGPYPFFMVHKQSVKATVIWMVALIIFVTIISMALALPFK